MKGLIAEVPYREDDSIFSNTHPPIFKQGVAKEGNGIIVAGTLIALDGSGEVDFYDPGGIAPLNAVKGVLKFDIDTTAGVDSLAVYGVHGVPVLADLKVGPTGTAPTAADIAALEAIGIWPQ